MTYEGIVSDCRWMTQRGLDVLLYAYLKHLFDQGASVSGESIIRSICRDLPQMIKEFLLAFEKKEPDALPELAVECLQDLRRAL